MKALFDHAARSGATWTTPGELGAVLHRLWSSGQLLAARLKGEALFPMSLQLRRPTLSALNDRFDDVQRWISSMERQDRKHQGFGYQIGWSVVESRTHGTVHLPISVVVPSELDALRLLGKEVESTTFDALARTTVKVLPALGPWLANNPLRALKYAVLWDRMIALIQWFSVHPHPRLYVRQIDVPGVDRSFVEKHRAFIGELLDEVLPAEAIDSRASKVRGFEQRYGLLAAPPRIRFRILDQRHAIGGLTDLAVPYVDFSALACGGRFVFITESEANGLAFPDVADGMVIFLAPENEHFLAAVPWLRNRTVFYWGNIGAAGFERLDRMRAGLPHLHSFLMDRETLLAHREMWDGDNELALRRSLGRLTQEEAGLLTDLQCDHFGTLVRLDQDRVSYRWLVDRLTRTLGTAGSCVPDCIEPLPGSGAPPR
jgi:hypothetical protein